jgi:nucleoside-diphosphate-sugar epimerase
VRDSWSDIAAAGQALGYAPAVAFEEGLRRTIDWIERERAADLR